MRLRNLLDRAVAERSAVTIDFEMPGRRKGAATASPILTANDCSGSVLVLRDIEG